MKKQSALLLTLLSFAFVAPVFAQAQTDAMKMDAMKKMDMNKDGKVSKDEATKMGMSMDKFMKMDNDKNGFIDEKEFLKMYEPG
jgi:Ni/Co efflux regulator RcnB